jgi:hypothetical protein
VIHPLDNENLSLSMVTNASHHVKTERKKIAYHPEKLLIVNTLTDIMDGGNDNYSQ